MNKIKGSIPVLQWINIKDLKVDRSYQRMIEGSVSRKLIEEIAENFDWSLCSPLVVSDRKWDANPGYYIIDGQHRWQAALIRGDIKEMPCIKTNFMSVENEARYFVAVNSSRKQVTSLDKYHARIASKEPLALRIKEIIKRANMKVTRYSDADLWNPGEISFPDFIGNIAIQKGDKFAREMLELLYCAYPNSIMIYGKDICDGLSIILSGSITQCKDQEKIKNDLAIHIGKTRQSHWKSEAKMRAAKENMTTGLAMAFEIIKDFDHDINLVKKGGFHGN